MEAFRRTDHAAVLACLTDDVEWVMPGFFHLHGVRADRRDGGTLDAVFRDVFEMEGGKIRRLVSYPMEAAR